MISADFAYRQDETFIERIERVRKGMGIYMIHTPRDDEYMVTLSYRVDQAIVACEERIANLRRLQGLYSA